MLKESRLYWNVRKDVLHQILKNCKDQNPPTIEEVLRVLSQMGFEEQLGNTAQNCTNRKAK